MNLVLPAEARRERNEIANSRALNSRAEENDNVLFSFERGLELHHGFA